MLFSFFRISDTMSYHRELDQTTDEYEINVDNCSLENNLSEGEPSTAGNFPVVLSKRLDLTSLIYLRSSDAEMNLSSLQLNGLPLSFTRAEDCIVQFSLPPSIGSCNQLFDDERISSFNENFLRIPTTDHVCPSPSDAISYMNNLTAFQINHFIISRYLRAFLDTNVLPDLSKGPFSASDIRLLLNYVDAGLYTRKALHLKLSSYLDPNDRTQPPNIVYTVAKQLVSQAQEASMLEESDCIIPLADRMISTKPKIVDFSHFHSLAISVQPVPHTPKETEDVKDHRTKITALINTLHTNIQNWLKDMRFNLQNIKQSDKNEIKAFVASNKSLIKIGLLARQLLLLEKERDTEAPKRRTLLFHADFLNYSLDLSRQRCVFHTQPDTYLYNDSSIRIFLPKKVSYTLGADIDQFIMLGPFTVNMPTITVPRLSNSIQSSTQLLPNAIRNVPHVLHITSNLTCGKGVDSFLSNTPFSDHHIMYTYYYDESTTKNRSIVVTHCDAKYFRVKESHKLVERFEISILDENFQQVCFPARTYTRCAFQVRPVGST